MNYLRNSFVFSLFFAVVTAYYLYALDRIGAWQFTPGYLLFIFFVLSLYLLNMSFKKQRNTIPQKIVIGITIFLNVIITVVLCIYLFFFLLFPRSIHFIEMKSSPDKKIQLNFYSFDAGAMGTFGIIGEVAGPLWFKKRIYYEKRVEEIKVEWIDNNTVLINEVLIEL